MFGPMAGQFWGGYMQEGDRIERRRLDFSRAFNEFRRDNPHATLDDLQGQINSIYGGRNFLYGAPSNEVLQSISAQNQQRLAERNAMQQIEMAQRQAQTQRSVFDTAREIARMAPDAATAQQSFNEMFGNNPVASRIVSPDMMAGLHSRAGLEFASDPRNRELAIQVLRSGRTLKEIFPDQPSHMIQGLEQAARGEITRQDEDRRRQLRSTASQEMDLALRSGARTFNAQTGFADLDGELNNRFTEQVRTRDGQLLNQEADELSKDQAVQSQLLAGQRDEVRAMLARRIEGRIGRAPTDAEVTTAIDRVISGARMQQSSQMATARTALDANAQAAFKSEFETRRDLGGSVIGNERQRAALFGTDTAGVTAGNLIQQLHERYAFSAEEIQAMGRYLRTSEGKAAITANPTENTIMGALRQQFPTILNRGDRATQERRRIEDVRRAAGLDLAQPTRVEDFVATTLANTSRSRERSVSQLQGELEKIQSFTPDVALGRLSNLQREAVLGVERFEQELSRRLQTQNVWRDPSGRNMTQEDATQLLNEARQTQAQLLALIEDARRAAQARAAQQGRAPGQPGQQQRQPGFMERWNSETARQRQQRSAGGAEPLPPGTEMPSIPQSR
jgi:hypothetical protein